MRELGGSSGPAPSGWLMQKETQISAGLSEPLPLSVRETETVRHRDTEKQRQRENVLKGRRKKGQSVV